MPNLLLWFSKIEYLYVFVSSSIGVILAAVVSPIGSFFSGNGSGYGFVKDKNRLKINRIYSPVKSFLLLVILEIKFILLNSCLLLFLLSR